MISFYNESGSSVSRRAGRRGFTLIELLVTVTIIAILAGVVLGALNAARHSAREARTKSTIAKLDDIIMRKYEGYLTRRIPISTSGLDPDDAARDRLDAVRILLRMEMPEQWDEVTEFDPANPVPAALAPLESWPTLYHRFYRYHESVNPTDNNDDIELAECLYMIVAIGGAADMEVFGASEIGDVDGDGAAEFLDGWGHPIPYLRWAPGFTPDSAIQTDEVSTDPNDPSKKKLVALDPFDPMELDVDTTSNPREGYQLYPLVFSRGPDGKLGFSSFSRSDFNDPWDDPTIGEDDGTGNHHDNIHNHRIEAR